MTKPSEYNFSKFLGQREIIEALRNEVEGAKALKVPVSHMLFMGNPGFGKTTLARCLAGEFPAAIHELCASRKLYTEQLFERVKAMDAFDFLFIDEIHTADNAVQEALQRIVTDHVMRATVQDAATGAFTQTDVRIPEITVIGATDQPEKILKALRSRFSRKLTLLPYTKDELKDIVWTKASDIGMLLTDDAARLIASRTTSPREVENQLQLIRKLAAVKQISEVTPELVMSCLESNGIHEFGLAVEDQFYLKIVAKAASDGEQLTTISSHLGLSKVYVQSEIETKLKRLDLIQVKERRYITLKGVEYMKRNKP